jgi:hypothetical protein
MAIDNMPAAIVQPARSTRAALPIGVITSMGRGITPRGATPARACGAEPEVPLPARVLKTRVTGSLCVRGMAMTWSRLMVSG